MLQRLNYYTSSCTACSSKRTTFRTFVISHLIKSFTVSLLPEYTSSQSESRHLHLQNKPFVISNDDRTCSKWFVKLTSQNLMDSYLERDPGSSIEKHVVITNQTTVGRISFYGLSRLNNNKKTLVFKEPLPTRLRNHIICPQEQLAPILRLSRKWNHFSLGVEFNLCSRPLKLITEF